MPIPPLTEHVFFDRPHSCETNTWWSRYYEQLQTLSTTARASVEADSRYIVDRGIFGAGTPGAEAWPASRARSGLVMGSVQSGKTSSMLGVAALAMDRGVDIVVILAGTRLSLWRQTYSRVLEQLDAGPNTVAKQARRILCPSSSLGLSEANVPLVRKYALVPPNVRQRLAKRSPIIVVAMKETNHLRALKDSLRKNVFDAVTALNRPVHMLVLDDEADDGSILDAVAETGRDPVHGNLKQIPRTIANLWDPPQGSPTNLFATYIAYTATPQAILLQEDHNPLAPRDFMAALRTPLDVGIPVDVANPGNLDAPRSSTFPEPQGLTSFYTGGETFYRRGRAAGLCRPLTADPVADRADALRAFLVAGAIRLHRSQALGPVAAASSVFDTAEETRALVMAPHSMLCHPSGSIASHFRAAEDILLWAGVPDRLAARTLLEEGSATLPDTLVEKINAETSLWEAWLVQYRTSANVIETEFGVINPPVFPDWPTTMKLLTEQIIPGTRISVVNSDPTADDRPSYEPAFDNSSGRWRAPSDLCTIFVSGNVMARGITLEGLSTTLFQRASDTPLADTQMQMQRWFGYRGSYIELCRVFASEEQLDLFSAYDDIDGAIRSTITAQMSKHAPEPTVLQGANFNATGKIADVRNYPLSPGGRPFIKLVNDGKVPDPNLELVEDLFNSLPSTDVNQGSRRLGRILDEPFSLLEAADWLDKFCYSSYAPGDQSGLAKHWEQIEARLCAILPLSEKGLYRPPLRGKAGDEPRKDSPYSIAAYLRLWEAGLRRPIKGLFVTGEPGHLWSMSDLQHKQRSQPRFWIGIRFGNGHPIRMGTPAFNVMTTIKAIGTNGELTTGWGTSTPTAGPGQYRSDIYFDYYHRNEPPPITPSDSTWRPAGADGQILIYINQGVHDYPVVSLGLCLPAGGPEQFAATRATVTLR